MLGQDIPESELQAKPLHFDAASEVNEEEVPQILNGGGLYSPLNEDGETEEEAQENFEAMQLRRKHRGCGV